MAKLNKKFMVSFLLFCLLLSINFGVGDGDGGRDDDDETSKIPTNIIDAAKRLYSMPTTASHSWFLPSNLDFRAGGGGDKEEEDASVAAKVKDAVVKSLDKTTAAVQDSAKSAANSLNNLKKTCIYK